MVLTDKQLESRLDEMFDLSQSDNVTLENLREQINPNSIDLIRTETDRVDLTADIPEGISSLKYYVTDLAGNRSEIIGK